MATAANFSIFFDSELSWDNSTWQAPDLTELKWSDCTPITDYWADVINIYNKADPNDLSSFGNAGKLADFLNGILPDDWPEAPNLLFTATWYYYVWSSPDAVNNTEYLQASKTLESMLVNECRLELCGKLEVLGDPDVSGPGMMGSYYVAAALSTMYFIILVVNRFRGDRLKHRFFLAFRDSANTFLDALLIFTASILASTVYRYGSFSLSLRDGDVDPDSFSSYQLMGAVALSVFSVFPCIVLQTVSGGLRVRTESGERRIRALRLLLWIIIVVLTITVEVQYRHVYIKLWDNIANFNLASKPEYPGLFREYWWLSNCDNLHLWAKIVLAVHAGHIILGIQLAWLVYSVVASVIDAWFKKERESPFERIRAYKIRQQSLGVYWKQWRPFVRVANGVMCLAMLWVLLVLFTLYRNHQRDVAAETSLDGKWTFGQVLSLFTWVPVLLEWAVILFSGSESGLSQRVPDKYEVVKIKERQLTEYSTTSDYNLVAKHEPSKGPELS